MNIVEKVQAVVDFELLDYEKKFVEKCYESITKNNLLFYIQPRGCGKFKLSLLQAVVVMVVSDERGLLKKGEN